VRERGRKGGREGGREVRLLAGIVLKMLKLLKRRLRHADKDNRTTSSGYAIMRKREEGAREVDSRHQERGTAR